MALVVKPRPIQLQAWECKCERCGWVWTSVGKGPPRACAACKATNWQRPARPYAQKAKHK